MSQHAPDPAPGGNRSASPTLPAVAMVLGGISSIQVGAALAIDLFDEVGASGAVLLRIFISAVLLLLIWRPALAMDRTQIKLALAFGLAMAGMNLSFYEAIDRIPLGTAVTFEFVGPLGVALLTSHRRRDMVWAAIAAAGILLLMGGVGDDGLNGLGVTMALVAGIFWGAYILLGKRVGDQWTGGKGLAIAMVVAALICMPFGIADGGSELLAPAVLGIGTLVAILSTTLPLSLEMEAMRRLHSNVFGVMMSLEPAVAALVGFLLLSQGLSAIHALAIGLVVAASAGALWTGRAPPPIDP